MSRPPASISATPSSRPRLSGFVAWAVVGALLACGISQVGLLTVPLGLVLGAVVLGRTRGGAAMFGALVGAAAVALLVALQNLDYRRCPEDGILTLAPGQHDLSCGGLPPGPWFIAAALLAAAGLAGYATARRRAP